MAGGSVGARRTETAATQRASARAKLALAATASAIGKVDVGVARHNAPATALLIVDQPPDGSAFAAAVGWDRNVGAHVALVGGAEGATDAEPVVPRPAPRLKPRLLSSARVARACSVVVVYRVAGQGCVQSPTVSSRVGFAAPAVAPKVPFAPPRVPSRFAPAVAVGLTQQAPAPALLAFAPLDKTAVCRRVGLPTVGVRVGTAFGHVV